MELVRRSKRSRTEQKRRSRRKKDGPEITAKTSVVKPGLGVIRKRRTVGVETLLKLVESAELILSEGCPNVPNRISTFVHELRFDDVEIIFSIDGGGNFLFPFILFVRILAVDHKLLLHSVQHKHIFDSQDFSANISV